MKKQKYRLVALCLVTLMLLGALPMSALAVGSGANNSEPGYWVVDPANQKEVTIEQVGNTLVMDNGIIQRTIDLNQNGVTISFKNLFKDWELVTSPATEAIIGIDGTKYPVGGTAENAFQYSGYEILDETAKDFDWEAKDYTTKVNPWPAIGKSLILTYDAPESLGDMQVKVRYDVYKGIAVLSKVATLINNSGEEVRVTYMACDQMNVNPVQKEMLYVESNYNGGGDMNQYRNLSYSWSGDTISVAFDMGPDWPVASGKTMDSFRAYELLHSVTYDEWKLVEVKNMYSIVAPWTNDNPLSFDLLADDSESIRNAVDHCAAIGFDTINQSFGSGINVESTNEAYLQQHKEDYAYAHSKGIEIGGYTLACVEDYAPVEDNWAVNGPGSGSAYRCLYSEWSEQYWENIHNFYEVTEGDFLAVDGPYHFYTCNVDNASEEVKAEHKYHTYENSRYAQWLTSTKENFAEFRDQGVALNLPDWMYLCGGNKAGIGYEEVGWSQPREEQLLISRIYNYNGTFIKNPSMGWSFIPIEVYHGGGTAAQFEPLNQNLKDYEWALAESIASGVRPTFRGKRLFDTEETKNIVKYWVDIDDRYSALLNSNTIHFLKPEQDPEKPTRTTGIDGIMQAFNDPNSTEKAFIMLFNQTDTARTETITIPVYFTGLTDLEEPPCPVPYSHPQDLTIPFYGTWPPVKSIGGESDTHYEWPEATATDNQISLYQEGKLDTKANYTIDSNGNIQMTITIPAMSFTWFVGADPSAELDPPIEYPGKSCDIITDGGDGELPAGEFDAGNMMVLDNADKSITYTGDGWTHDDDEGSVNDTLSRTSKAGDSAKLTFTGEEITLVAEAGYASGEVEILIDGKSAGTTTWQKSVTDKRQLVWKAADLENTEHTIEIKNVSGELTIDAFLFEDPFAVLDLSVNAGNGKEATLYKGRDLGYTLDVPENLDLTGYETALVVSQDDVLNIDTENKTMSVQTDLAEDATVTVYATMTGEKGVYRSPMVTVHAKSEEIDEWKALDQTGSETWQTGEVHEENGVLTVYGSGLDNTLVNQLISAQKGTYELEMKVSDTSAIPGLLLNAVPDSYSNEDKGQALRILFRDGSLVSLERCGVSGAYGTGNVQWKANDWMKIRCVFENSRVQVYINDQLVVDVRNDSLNASGGNIGMFLWADNDSKNVQFRNVKFTDNATFVYANAVSVTTNVGVAPKLPDTIQVTDGSMITQEAVVWEKIDPQQYAQTGTFTVYGTVEKYDLRVQAVVTVEAGTAVTGVTLDKESAELEVNGTLTLTATVVPENATNKNVTWSSSNETIATVNNGIVTAMKAGMVTITVTTADGGYTATCDVTVTEHTPEQTHTVRLFANGGTVTPTELTVKHGETADLPVPTHSGSYEFEGWFTANNVKVTKKTPIMDDMTLYAHWSYTGGTHVKPEEPDQKPETPVVDADFIDVRPSDWYYDAVAYVSENGIMTGVAEGVFNPDGTVTRAMVWTVLARMDGVNTEGGSSWYAKAQAWAIDTGVSDGTDPNGAITREQLAAMLYRFEGSPVVTGSLSAYPDATAVSDWAADAMVWATETGLINGINGYLKPQDGATRAQLATMLMRFSDIK